jgi:hypothetical protein
MRLTIRVLFLIMAALVLSACPDPVGPASADPVPDPVTPVVDQVITMLAIPENVVPALGRTPLTSIDTVQYTATIAWSPAVETSFAASTVYTATVTVLPKTGWTLTGVGLNSFTLTGATSVTYEAGSSTVTVVFPATGSPAAEPGILDVDFE